MKDLISTLSETASIFLGIVVVSWGIGFGYWTGAKMAGWKQIRTTAMFVNTDKRNPAVSRISFSDNGEDIQISVPKGKGEVTE